eukprot:g33344.t1
MNICEQFELALAAKVNQSKSKAIFFGNWADQSFILFIVRTDYLKVLEIWFSGARACTKSWEECIAKVKQKLVLREHSSLSTGAKDLVIRCEALSLLYKFAKKITFDHKSIRKWVAGSILETLWKKDNVDP